MAELSLSEATEWMARLKTRVRLTAGWADYDTSELIEIGGRLVPRRIDVTFPSTADNWPAASFCIEVRNGAPVCTEMSVRAHPEGREVRSVDIRAIRLEDWIENIVADVSLDLDRNEAGEVMQTFGARHSDSDFQAARQEVRYARRNARRTVDETLLAEVADIYRAHVNDRPTEAVRTAFGTSYRTAARYVELARATGLLPATTPGKKNA